MTVRLRPPRLAAHTGLVSLAVMPADPATARLRPVSSRTGPTHGCAYPFVVAAEDCAAAPAR